MATPTPLEQLVAAFVRPIVRRQARLLVAVSGGADSVALLRLLHATWPQSNTGQAPGQGGLAVAHFNHGVRGAASDEDARFVAALCQQLNVPLFVGKRKVSDDDSTAISEAALRGERYSFLIETARQIDAGYLTTAHTADDQVETVLHRVLRGTGMRGLAGMRRCRRLTPTICLVRPLLKVWREPLVKYLQSIGQTWREDTTNQDPRYFRNRLRHQLLPRLRTEYQPNVDDSLLRLAESAHSVQRAIDARVRKLERCAVEYDNPNHARIHLPRLRRVPLHILRELLVHIWHKQQWPLGAMSFKHWQRLAALCRRDTNQTAADFPGTVRATRRGSVLVLSQLAAP